MGHNDMNANSAAAAAGRLLMSIIFLLSGFQKLGGFSGTVAYMASLNLPLPELAAIVAIVVECVGGLLLLVGYQTRAVGLVLAVWCVATALVAHINQYISIQTLRQHIGATASGRTCGFLQGCAARKA